MFQNNNGYNFDLKTYYSDLNMLGKHYTIEMLDKDHYVARDSNHKVEKRQYTIANCLKKDFYEKLVKVIIKRDRDPNCHFTRENKGCIKSLISDKHSNLVSVCIKTYNLEQGLARRFFDIET